MIEIDNITIEQLPDVDNYHGSDSINNVAVSNEMSPEAHTLTRNPIENVETTISPVVSDNKSQVFEENVILDEHSVDQINDDEMTESTVQSEEDNLKVDIHPSSAPAETTVSNVEFIPFRMEDAVMHLMNDSAPTIPLQHPETSVDPKLLERVPMKQSREEFSSPQFLVPPISLGHQLIPQALRQDSAFTQESPQEDVFVLTSDGGQFRQNVMDVPVSTSLYNNGFFDHQDSDEVRGKGEIITLPSGFKFLDNFSTMEETNHEPEKGPAQSFSFRPEEAIVPKPMGQRITVLVPEELSHATRATPVTIKTTPTPVSYKPPAHAVSFDGSDITYPMRIHSKFGLDDTPKKTNKVDNMSTVSMVNLKPNISPSAVELVNTNSDGFKPSEIKMIPVVKNVNKYEGSYLNSAYDDELYDQHPESYENYRAPGSPEMLGLGQKAPVNHDQIPSSDVVRPDFSSPSGPVESDSFKPVVAFPFTIKKKVNNPYNMGLKLSGCNIYGKMYSVGHAIRELSSPCVECRCTDIGVQCSDLPC